ncbi:TOBE domain-containing protein [Snodgrassella sp. CFCC 13594]|uniref:TOBE domain-containing protein n=1 Tax=Snodgrassella sp. CFCC 13594 TaxID=1775559 RepID=UPI0008309C1E|nr:TOBE domain-containing protein [Snodgrassella sp. CFCC 13594]
MTVFSLDSELRPTIDGQRIGNPNRIVLLEQIDQLGSISQAAKAVPMSYKAAWDAIDAINNIAPQPLVMRQTGGKGGGTSTLTDFGRQFVRHYRQLEQLHQTMMVQLQQTDPAFSPPNMDLWQRLNMHFSADNQLFGKITTIHLGAVNNEIHVQLPNGMTLVAIVTQDSTQRMGLQIGSEVFALIQASAILVADDLAGVHLSARNQLPARIKRIHQGSVNTEIACDLGDGLSLNAVITCVSAETMKLQPEMPVTLVIKAPNIILGKQT